MVAKDPELFRLVAASHLIVVATPQMPVEVFDAATKSEPTGQLDLPMADVSVMKGEPPHPSFMLRFLPNDGRYPPSTLEVRSRLGVSSLFLLLQIDGTRENLTHFASYSERALQADSEAKLAPVRHEISVQAAALKAWRADTRLPYYHVVGALISKLSAKPDLTAREQANIFRRLEAFGPAAVPAIIAQMDDQRKLLYPEIKLRNRSPDAFEAFRFYSPERVVDGLDAILNQITGENFSAIANGGSERERRLAVTAWRTYISFADCSKGKTSKK